jgi:hypothetical protein
MSAAKPSKVSGTPSILTMLKPESTETTAPVVRKSIAFFLWKNGSASETRECIQELRQKYEKPVEPVTVYDLCNADYKELAAEMENYLEKNATARVVLLGFNLASMRSNLPHRFRDTALVLGEPYRTSFKAGIIHDDDRVLQFEEDFKAHFVNPNKIEVLTSAFDSVFALSPEKVIAKNTPSKPKPKPKKAVEVKALPRGQKTIPFTSTAKKT